MKKVVIIGAGGHHKVIKEMIEDSSEFEVFAIVDNRFEASYEENGIIYAPFSFLNELFDRESSVLFVIAIGNNEVRRKIAVDLGAKGAQFATIVHPSAVVSKSAVIGAGTVVMANSVINADAVIGQQAIINTGSIIEHDCRIGDYAHLSSGCVIAGGAIIGEQVYLKAGMVILQNETILFQKEINS